MHFKSLERPHRVLFLRPDRVGDMILTTGLLRGIAESAPTITLDVLASALNAPVLGGSRRGRQDPRPRGGTHGPTPGLGRRRRTWHTLVRREQRGLPLARRRTSGRRLQAKGARQETSRAAARRGVRFAPPAATFRGPRRHPRGSR